MGWVLIALAAGCAGAAWRAEARDTRIVLGLAALLNLAVAAKMWDDPDPAAWRLRPSEDAPFPESYRR